MSVGSVQIIRRGCLGHHVSKRFFQEPKKTDRSGHNISEKREFALRRVEKERNYLRAQFFWGVTGAELVENAKRTTKALSVRSSLASSFVRKKRT